MIEEREGEVNWAALVRRVCMIQERILYTARGYAHTPTIRYVLCRPNSKQCNRPELRFSA
jgi:hypothetical protein